MRLFKSSSHIFMYISVAIKKDIDLCQNRKISMSMNEYNLYINRCGILFCFYIIIFCRRVDLKSRKFGLDNKKKDRLKYNRNKKIDLILFFDPNQL